MSSSGRRIARPCGGQEQSTDWVLGCGGRWLGGRRFLLKSMTSTEHQLLLDVLHDYHDYLKGQPSSLLTR